MAFGKFSALLAVLFVVSAQGFVIQNRPPPQQVQALYPEVVHRRVARDLVLPPPPPALNLPQATINIGPVVNGLPGMQYGLGGNIQAPLGQTGINLNGQGLIGGDFRGNTYGQVEVGLGTHF